MKKTLIKVIIACLIISGIGAGGYYGYKKYKASKATVTTNSYMTVTAKKMNMQVNVQGTGSAYAAVSRDIMPNNNGVLKELNLKLGDTVKASDKLFTADSDDLRQNVTKAQSNLDKQNLTLSNAKNDNEKSMDNLSVNDAQSQLNYAYQQLNNMTVTAPINGIITAENNSNGDSVQQGKAVLSIADPSSMKIKVAVDELDIAKIKQGQKAEIKFDAIQDKTYEGTVESIAQVGTSTNNVTTYDVVVAITNPSDIKIGMNANVNILVDSKDNALTIPTEALIERNGNKYVMVPNSDSTAKSNAGSASQNVQNTSGNNGQGNQNWQGGNGQGSRNGRNSGGYMGAGYSGSGKLVQIKTGLVNENYIEVLDGITEGQKVLISLPKSSSTTNANNRNGFGGNFGGGFGGGFGGNMGGRNQGGNSGSRSGNSEGKN